MSRSYAHPEAFKQALEERLRRHAQRAGRDLQRLRQLVVFDRFLARVFGAHPEAFVLKGGLALELRSDHARTTRDVDLRVAGHADRLLDWLQQAGQLALGDFLAFLVEPDPAHPIIQAEGLPYGGRRFRVEARLAGKVYGARFSVDIAVGEPLVGRPDTIVGPDLLGFAGISPARLRLYPVVAHLAEKVHAYTLPRERPNSRVKDLPDLALLASSGPLAAAELRRAIQKTFTNRGTHAVPARVPAPPANWTKVYAQMARQDQLPWADLAGLTEVVSRFLDPVLADERGRWDPKVWRWRR